MSMLSLALGCCLLAQATPPGAVHEPRIRPRQTAPATRYEAPAEEEPPPPEEAEPPTRARAATQDEAPPEVDERHAGSAPPAKVRPPELLTEALEKPREAAVVGTPITLRQALSHSADRGQQLRITQAYWRLCAAQASYHWSLNERNSLAHFTEGHTNSPNTLSARAAARSQVLDAQLAVVQAQQDLVDLLGAQADSSPPLTLDRPHVGDYRTSYETLFANRAPPPRIRLIHRTLPVRRKAIDAHAAAVVSSMDAVEATGEDFQKHGQGLSTFLAALELLRQERRAFINDVRDYNMEIAEYAFAVAPPGANEQSLVSMMIKTLPPPPNQGAANRTGDADSAVIQVDGESFVHTANFQPDDPEAADEQGVFQGLLDIEKSAERAERLSNLLHWDRNLPADAGEPITLAECLRGTPPGNRMAVITAFWNARECVASYQILADQVEQLSVLPPIAIRLHDEPGMHEAGVRLQASRRAAHAALVDAHVAVLLASFDLTQVAGRRVDQAWVLPSTPPQSGRYVVSTRKAILANRQARHWGEAIRLGHNRLEQGSDALIQADRHRAAMVNETRRGAAADAQGPTVAEEPLRLDGAVRAIARQRRQALELVHDLTAYNLAIASYALVVLPESMAGDELAKKLAVERSTRRDT